MTQAQIIRRACAVTALALSVALMTAEAQASVVISAAPTRNMNCSNGVCASTASKAVLNVGDLTGMLAASDVTVEAANGAKDIDVAAPFSWVSTSRLTLDAARSINVDQSVTVAGTGALTLTTNDGGTAGVLSFGKKGSVTFWDLSSSLVIDANAYTLVADIATLASAIHGNAMGSFALANDYNVGVDGTYHSAPIPTPFHGRLEGLGHTISHLAINDSSTSDSVGLFQSLEDNSSVENLAFAAMRIKSTSVYGPVGGLVGTAHGLIQNVAAEGDIVAAPAAEAGEIVGENGGTLMVCRTRGNVHGATVGGAAGVNYGTIRSCSSSGNVTGTVAGGVSGYVVGTVDLSSATGSVTGSGSYPYVGGLVGWFYAGAVTRSFANGAVSGHAASAGGLIGVISASAGDGYVTDDYATGPVSADAGSFVGGFAGWDTSTPDFHFRSGYSIGAVSGDGELGGFAGREENPQNIRWPKAYWDLDASGIGDPKQGCGNTPLCHSITGLSDAELKSALPDGFNPKVWGQSPGINNGYPYLLANPPRQ